MIDAREATRISREYFDAMYDGTSMGEVLLEEIELVEDGKFWLITYGFDRNPTSGTSSIGPGDRKHKAVKLDAESGQMISMKIVSINAY